MGPIMAVVDILFTTDLLSDSLFEVYLYVRKFNH